MHLHPLLNKLYNLMLIHFHFYVWKKLYSIRCKWVRAFYAYQHYPLWHNPENIILYKTRIGKQKRQSRLIEKIDRLVAMGRLHWFFSIFLRCRHHQRHKHRDKRRVWQRHARHSHIFPTIQFRSGNNPGQSLRISEPEWPDKVVSSKTEAKEINSKNYESKTSSGCEIRCSFLITSI